MAPLCGTTGFGPINPRLNLQEFDAKLSHFLQIKTSVSGLKPRYIKACRVVQRGLDMRQSALFY